MTATGMRPTRQSWRSGRAIVMIALAYLFVLQGLMAPAAMLAGARGLAAMAMPLCDDPGMAAVRQDGGPAGGEHHRACCDLGCLPHKAGLSVAAAPPPSGAVLPPPRPARVAALRPEAGGAIAPAARPGLPGARAPPPSLA